MYDITAHHLQQLADTLKKEINHTFLSNRSPTQTYSLFFQNTQSHISKTTSGTAVVTGEVAFFDTLVDALTFDGTLAVGGQANIAGVDAIIDATEDGTRFFLDAVTGEPLR